MSSLYHYTSLDSFQKMLTGTLSKENQCVAESPYNQQSTITVHLSHIRYMNDTLEYEYFNNLLWRAIQSKDLSITKDQFAEYIKTVEIFSEPFIFSLSTKSDFLPMWKMYSDNVSGVMIEFDKVKLEKVSNKSYKIEKCYYAKNIDDAVVAKCIQAIHGPRSAVADIISTMNLGLRNNLTLYKSPDFDYEKEWRLHLRTNIILTKTSQGKIKLYTDVAIPATCIKSITLAPCMPERDLQKKALAHLLSTKGLDESIIHYSKITGYRNI